MSDNRNVDLESTSGIQRVALEKIAREVLREWMRDVEGQSLQRVGLSAVMASADAMTHLSNVSDERSAGSVLDAIEQLARDVVTSVAVCRPRWWSSASLSSTKPACDGAASLVAGLDRERDAGTRRMIALSTTATRLARADRGLADAMQLIRILRNAVGAAVRELRGADPARAAIVKEHGEAILLEREQTVLNQAAIHHQAMMTLDLLTANQQALNVALEQARTATLSALQVAAAARRATSDAAVLTTTTDLGRVRQILDDALVRGRAALKAMTPAEGGRSPLDL